MYRKSIQSMYCVYMREVSHLAWLDLSKLAGFSATKLLPALYKLVNGKEVSQQGHI